MSKEPFPEHVAWDVVEHEAVATTDFDFDGVDEALGFIHQAPPPARREAAELLRRLATWCFTGHGLRPAMVKLVAIFGGLRPDLLQDRSGQDLARELGVSKAAISKQTVRFEDAFQMKFARGRSKEARRNMAAARIGGPCRNPPKHETTAPNQPA